VTDARPDLTAIPHDECWRLLASVSVGRVAMQTAEGLVVVPVNCAVDSGEVVFRTAEGGLLGQAADWGRTVAFQADRFDETAREGWSVLVRGQLRRAGEAEAAGLAQLVAPWAGGERNVVGRIAASDISGRRIGARPAAEGG